MKVKVTEKQVMITEITPVNEGEYGINECEFILPESFKELCVTAVFNGVAVQLVNSKCFVPSLKNGNCILGVYAYRQNSGETEIMYSPKPTIFFVDKGSFESTFNEERVPQIGDYDLYCEMLRNYWDDLIKSNTLPEYTEGAKDNQYYSAKVINGMYHSLQGALDEIGDLIGGGNSGETEDEDVYHTLVEEGKYSFEQNDTFENLCSVSLNAVNDVSMLREGLICKVTVGDAFDSICTLKNIDGCLICGNLSLVRVGDNTGEPFVITFEEGFPSLFYQATPGIYTVALLYKEGA